MLRLSSFVLTLLLLLPSTIKLHAQDWAKSRLEASPRHSEWVPLKHSGRTVNAYVVYPEIKTKAPVVILIHEIFGLTDWAKEMADEIAAAGYIVIAPDLLTGFGPNGGGFDAFPSQGDAQKAVSLLNADTVNDDLSAAADYAKTIPSANGKLFVTGYCWGGGKSFLFATKRHDLTAAFVFYGPPPAEADLKNITAPVYGFYAGNDARISSTVPATTETMKSLGKKYEPVIYEGAGHGFMRAGEDPTQPTGNTTPEMAEANKKARTQGFARMTSLLKQLNTGKVGFYMPISNKSLAKASPPTKPVECHDPDMHIATPMTGSM
jgi:carboxymethylenebutenolidase